MMPAQVLHVLRRAVSTSGARSLLCAWSLCQRTLELLMAPP